MSCLIIKNDGLGDFVLASGIIGRLAEHFGGELDLVTCEANKELAEMIPGVRRLFLVSRDTLRFGRRFWKLGILRASGSVDDLGVLRKIRRERYEVGISLRRFIRQSTLVIMREVRAKARYCAWQYPTNADEKQARRASRGWRHYQGGMEVLWEPAYYRGFLGNALGLDLDPTPRLQLDDAVPGTKLCQRSVALGIAGSTATWPHEYWIALAEHLARSGWSIGLFGGSDSAAVAEKIAQSTGSQNWVGRLSFRDTAAALGPYTYYIGYDTGLSHFASLIVEKTLIIYGGGTFRRFFPWPGLRNQHVIYHGLQCYDCTWRCQYPVHYCLTMVTPAEVANFFLEIVSGGTERERDLNPINETYGVGRNRTDLQLSVRPS